MSTRTDPVRSWTRASIYGLAAMTLCASTACKPRDQAVADTSAARTPAPAADSSAATPSDSSLVLVRGTVAAASDTALDVTTSTGVQRVRVVGPLEVYERQKSDLAHVQPNSFVGITSEPQADGSQRATEIHIFPEALRGLGEGSRPREAAAGGARGTMTNGAVAPSRMTNGAVTGGAGATTYTVRYAGGAQSIAIPPDVTVTAIAPTHAKAAVGAGVVVLAHKDQGGRLTTSAVMLTGPQSKR